MKNYLNFENQIKNIENEIEKLKDPFNKEGISEVNTNKINKLEKELNLKLEQVYSKLDPWQRTMVARHEERPKAKYFIDNLFQDFFPLSGDRLFGEDKSLIAGIGKFQSYSVMVFGQEKGEDLDTRIERNFGMMRPEGYRKSIRLMKLADKFELPIIFLIDTPGAYPGVGAEERGQAEAIAKSIETSLSIGVPTMSIIIGEGGSGGAIALASTNKVIMFENAIYSVISPEGCASILWRDPKKTLEAASAMKLTSNDLFKLKIIDEIISEPTGGAHRDKELMLSKLKISIEKNLLYLTGLSREQVIREKKNKFLNIGRDKGLSDNTLSSDKLFTNTTENLMKYSKSLIKRNKYLIISLVSFIILFSIIYM
tara:strand:+ start:26533 stop:27639 length:1107 start_codon:yes stop_codon:yes gene_type:complete